MQAPLHAAAAVVIIIIMLIIMMVIVVGISIVWILLVKMVTVVSKYRVSLHILQYPQLLLLPLLLILVMNDD